MCAIAGIFYHHPVSGSDFIASQAGLLGAMGDRLFHRGPDDGGIWLEEGMFCGLSHRRLSIIDTSCAGHQPMHSGDNRYSIAFNGEIYNFLELRADLESAGVVFQTRTDTEVLIESVRHWGFERALQRFDGMFAFALYDRREHTLVLARDPFGEKPLYYHSDNERFSFASELWALQKLPWVNNSWSEDVLGEFLAFQYINAPRSILPEVSKLPPGHFAVLRPGKALDIRRFFSFQPSGFYKGEPDFDLLADELEDILCRSLKRRLIADVPLGAFLSGGVDSSTVAALAVKRLGVPLQTYSIGFSEADESEHHTARKFAEILGTDHHEKVVAPDAAAFLHDASRFFDEPNGDTSCLPTYLLCQFARQHVTVAISGDGGDELFGGYGRYFDTLEEDRRWRKGGLPGWDAGTNYYSLRILLGLEEHLRPLFGGIPPELRRRLDALRDEINLAAPLPLLHRLRRTDVHNYMPGAVLPKVDRMSMQHALEVRTPFLNVELSRFAEKLPTNALWQPGRGGKLVLKHLARRLLPAEMVDLPKKGFGLPVSESWNRTLVKTVSDMLLASGGKLAQMLGRDRVQSFLTPLITTNPPGTYLLWAAGILESWLSREENPGPRIGAEADRAKGVVFRQKPAKAARDYQVATFLHLNGPSAVLNDAEDMPAVLLAQEPPVSHSPEFPPVVTVPSPGEMWQALSSRQFQSIWLGTWNPGQEELAKLGGFGVQYVLSGNARGQFANRLKVYFTRKWNESPFPDWEAPLVFTQLPARRERISLQQTVSFLVQKLPVSLQSRLRRALKIPHMERCGGRGVCLSFREANTAPWDRSQEFLILEDGWPLCFGGSTFEEIVSLGRGRWIAWGNQFFLSSSDGSDVFKNGKRYDVIENNAAIKDRLSSLVQPEPSMQKFQETLRAFTHPSIGDAECLNQPRSIAFYTSALSSGGAERQWCYLARAAAAQGISTSLLTNLPMVDGGDHYEELLVNTGVNLVPVAETPQTWGGFEFSGKQEGALLLALPPELREETARLVFWLLKQKPDALCCQLDPTNIQGALAGLIARVPKILLSFRNMRPTLMPHFCRDWFQDIYQILKNFPQIIFTGNSHEGNADYADWLGWKSSEIHHLPNIFDPSSLPDVAAEQIQRLKTGLDLADSQKIVLSVCRLSPEKQPDHALQAFEIAARDHPDLVFLQVGDGQMREELVARAESMQICGRCRFVEATSELSVYYSAADAFVLASKIEGTPNVLLEAQHYGTPVASYAVGGVPSCVVDGKTAFLAKPGDVGDLACAINRALASKSTINGKLRIQGKRFLEEGHAPGFVLQRLFQIMSSK